MGNFTNTLGARTTALWKTSYCTKVGAILTGHLCYYQPTKVGIIQTTRRGNLKKSQWVEEIVGKYMRPGSTAKEPFSRLDGPLLSPWHLGPDGDFRWLRGNEPMGDEKF